MEVSYNCQLRNIKGHLISKTDHQMATQIIREAEWHLPNKIVVDNGWLNCVFVYNVTNYKYEHEHEIYNFEFLL